MNAYAAACAGQKLHYERSVRAFALDVGASSVAMALALVPPEDYPLWLGSYMLSAACAMGDTATEDMLMSERVEQPGLPTSSADDMLAQSMRLSVYPDDVY